MAYKEINGIVIKQKTIKTETGQVENIYELFAESGVRLAIIMLPSDKQYMYDERTLTDITKALALRWGLNQPKKKIR